MGSKTDSRSVTLRAFSMLDALAGSTEPVGLQELARATRLPKPSAHRIAQMMEEADLIARSPQGGYEPGAALRRLAYSVVRRGASTAETRSVLREVVDATSESCALAVLDGGDVCFLEHAESPWPLRLALAAGSRVPAHCTAAGKILLAQFPPARRGRLLAGLTRPKLTPNTITEAEALDAILELVRARRFAIEDEEYLAGLVAIAVPVRSPAGDVIAALTVCATRARCDPTALESHLPLLTKSAERLGVILAGV